MRTPRWIYNFSEPLPPQYSDPKVLLGGKSAGLREMRRAGLRVPPGFTITTECCAKYFELGNRWPDGLEQQVRDHMADLERETGRQYARSVKPLLVSTRSGAAVSMPGMMDTILNCGLHPALAQEDAANTSNFWELYIAFVRSFARIVHGINEEAFFPGSSPSREVADACMEVFRERTSQYFPTDPWESLFCCIDAVFASWRSERAATYRARHEISGLAGTSVTIQEMFASEVSGVAFTEDPTAPDAGRMVVEASYGLGESVVSGEVTPDRFIVNRSTFAYEATIGQKRLLTPVHGDVRTQTPEAWALTPEQLRELVVLSLGVERHFGHPVDLEWGWANGQFALLQTRMIRGLEAPRELERVRQKEVTRLRSVAGSNRRCWVIHNLAETLPLPTPLTWDLMRHFMSGAGGFGQLYRRLGYRPSARVCRDGFLELIGGRIFTDPERLSELFWDALPLSYDVNAIVADKSVLDRAPTKFDADRADGRFLVALPGTLLAMWKAGKLAQTGRRDAVTRFQEVILPPFLSYVSQERHRRLQVLSEAELLAELHRRRIHVLDEFAPESLAPGFFGGVAFDALQAILVQLSDDETGGNLARTLTRALEGDTTVAQDSMLRDVAAGRIELQTFMESFGHRAIGEMELAEPRWREAPAFVERMVEQLRSTHAQDSRANHKAARKKRLDTENELPEWLAKAGGSSLLADILGTLKDAQVLLPYRETGKHYLMMGYELIRSVLEELARRWGIGRDIYFLQLEELEIFAQERDRLEAEISARRVRENSWAKLDLPDVIDSSQLEDLGKPRFISAAAEIVGVAISSGVATGPAQVIVDPRQASDLGAKYVLVCPSTDPGWTPLFVHAVGMVVERGGVLSHGAIVARDFGIPAVVCPNATRQIRSGQIVQIDGNRGRVLIVDQSNQGAPREETPAHA